ncbi:hypothetical protein ZHAS_00007683 [Anopheles sinensis]|uniref:ANK_REP_REGION domain-containing protein n=1 Tax=Anopheles sinensis TaxID=74873 RepID=A0A084VQ40_ANOSI|nr:hypothetical protein ZHAS_00007683 [Anopheles sinensis]
MKYSWLVKQKPEHIEKLLSGNPNILAKRDERKRFVLHWAAVAGREQLCKYILQRFPEQLDAGDDMEKTPLELAACGGSLATTALMVQEGADINHRDLLGCTALNYACSNDSFYVVLLLLREGADLNIADINGDTPLHRATEYGRSDIVNTLLLHGADPNRANSDGNTPLHLACERNEERCAILLVRGGATIGSPNQIGLKPFQLANPSLSYLLLKQSTGRRAG